MNTNPIGIFDSGVGGLSIWKEITTLLPDESTIYLADSANAPYGDKTQEEIIELCIKNTEKLISLDCKIIVVACNTATTNAINILRKKYTIPFIGIEPAIKPARLQTKTNSIGILATKGTLNSLLFAQTANKYMDGIKIIEIEGKGLVSLIETGKIHSPEMTHLLYQYIHPILQNNIDCLVLGCTHYPFLIPQIKKITGDTINIIDSGRAIAKQTKAILISQNTSNNISNSSPAHKIYSNLNTEIIKTLLNNHSLNFDLILEKF
ncbi:glutamate racemase [Flavicella sp.]|uniref:glutamate racemase n=1 Tax=Flavicella sp. TaxID=2957742 RepID=UPI00301A19CA